MKTSRVRTDVIESGPHRTAPGLDLIPPGPDPIRADPSNVTLDIIIVLVFVTRAGPALAGPA